MSFIQSQQKHDPDAPRGECHPKESPHRTSPPTPGNLNEKKKLKPGWKQFGTVPTEADNRLKTEKKKRGKSNAKKSGRSAPPLSDAGRIFMRL
ncbi:MAG TPA: hypothetical protein VN420_04225 [Candidatus Fimivivens sp.]|nr:hypothetical protein [Candidatus Fimivivens sp.]